MLDEWLGDLRAVGGLRRSTIRSYALAVSAFCWLPDRPGLRMGGQQCEVRFGTHPVQVCHEWNTAVHVQQAEGDPVKRAFTVDELQAFFDHTDRADSARLRGRGRRGGCQRSVTRPYSRSLTGTGCGAPRPGCSTSLTSAATRTPTSSASYGVLYVRHRPGWR